MKFNHTKHVICYGETLWDVFPTEKKPGGAPMNVAVHLSHFGIDPSIISRIGADGLGEELLEFLRAKGLKTNGIQKDKDHPTGVVNVEIGSAGDANYEIVFPSAWDFIEKSEVTDQLTEENYILIYGSLASRNDTSREALFYLLDRADLTVFDVNFRSPHYTRDLIELLLDKTNILKLNENEIEIIGQWHDFESNGPKDVCRHIASIYGIDQIVVTLGSDGAMVYENRMFHHHPGFKVDVVDTVGSGDSFLASYMAHLLSGNPVEFCLEIACATGAYVATQKGANPTYQPSGITEFMKSRVGL